MERPKIFCCKKFGLACLLLYIYEITYVHCQCSRPDGFPCLWMNDPNNKINWTMKTDQKESLIEVKNCSTKPCGASSVLSSWLQPSDSPKTIKLEYKIYGYSKVSLKVLLNYSNETKPPKLLFQDFGDYSNSLSTLSWATKSFELLKPSSRYRLSMVANLPYDKAYVAVKGVNLGTIEDYDQGADILLDPLSIARPQDIKREEILNDPGKTGGTIEEPKLSRGGFGNPKDSVSTLTGQSLISLTVLLAISHLFGSIMY